MVKKLTGIEWLKKQIAKIEITNSKFKKEIDEIIKIKPEIYNEFNTWTPLKLVLLNYALDVCSIIIVNMISKGSSFKKMYFIDLFAGSGINKLKNKDDFLIGSPLIAALNHGEKYTSMEFCQYDSKHPERSEALALRLASLKNPNLIINKEPYEDCLNEILNKTKEKGAYSLFFIDPDCMEFEWESMSKVLDNSNDILFNLMSSQIQRNIGLAKANRSEGEKLNRFFGNNSWENATSTDNIVKVYCENILKERPKTVIKIIKIKSAKHGFCYHMLFITRQTSTGNRWIRAIDKAKEEIESNSDKSVEMALDILKKRQCQLSNFH